MLSCRPDLCLQGQRTVYRLTLVKGYNTSDLQNYADLIALGKPDFIEVKVNISCLSLQIKTNVFAEIKLVSSSAILLVIRMSHFEVVFV